MTRHDVQLSIFNMNHVTWSSGHQVQAKGSSWFTTHELVYTRWQKTQTFLDFNSLRIDAWISKWNTIHNMMLLNIIHITWSFYHGAWSMSRFLAWFTGNLTSLVRTNQLLSIRLEVLISSGGITFLRDLEYWNEPKFVYPTWSKIFDETVKTLYNQFNASRTGDSYWISKNPISHHV